MAFVPGPPTHSFLPAGVENRPAPLQSSKIRMQKFQNFKNFKSPLSCPQVMWTTPLGLPVVQPYRRKDRQHVRTLLQVRGRAGGRKGRAAQRVNP